MSIYTVSQKNPPLYHYFFLQLGQKWSDLNNFWYIESRKHLTLVFAHLFNTVEKVINLVNCTTVFAFSKLYDFSPKLNNFEKQPAIMLPRNFNFRQPGIVTSYYRLRWHHSCISDIDLSPCSASIQPMSQQRADVAGTDVMHDSLHLVHIRDHSVIS